MATVECTEFTVYLGMSLATRDLNIIMFLRESNYLRDVNPALHGSEYGWIRSKCIPSRSNRLILAVGDCFTLVSLTNVGEWCVVGTKIAERSALGS